MSHAVRKYLAMSASRQRDFDRHAAGHALLSPRRARRAQDSFADHATNRCERPPDPPSLAFFQKILQITQRDVFHEGQWKFLELVPEGDAPPDG